MVIGTFVYPGEPNGKSDPIPELFFQLSGYMRKRKPSLLCFFLCTEVIITGFGYRLVKLLD